MRNNSAVGLHDLGIVEAILNRSMPRKFELVGKLWPSPCSTDKIVSAGQTGVASYMRFKIQNLSLCIVEYSENYCGNHAIEKEQMLLGVDGSIVVLLPEKSSIELGRGDALKTAREVKTIKVKCKQGARVLFIEL